MPVGKRIYLRRELPKEEMVRAFSELPASNVADVMNRNCAMHPRIRLMSRPFKGSVCGPALTVKCRGGDNLTLHAALDMTSPGDVLVVSCDGDENRALMGGIMAAYLKNAKHAAGIVLDGPIRDLEEISTWDFPLYATGTTPGGPYKDGPGEINVPISCGGVSVAAGDLILMDRDGVIVIPRRDADTVLPAAQKYHADDDRKLAAAKRGEGGRAWVAEAIRDKGYELIDEYWGL